MTGLPLDLVEAVHGRVRAKLITEPIEDLRIDFEDGLGARPDEDALAVAAASALLASIAAGHAPPFTGIRFKSLEAATRRRGIRTLDVFLGALGPLPEGFVVTLPKVSSVEQVEAMLALSAELEAAHALPAGSVRFELQIETPQAVLGADGTALVARMIHSAGGRCTGLHYGTYDYSASVGIAAGYQSMEHAAADHAKAIMQLAAAGTGVRLSDGSTNVLPVGTPSAAAVAWQLHARLVRRSLERGFYQGWDLHPRAVDHPLRGDVLLLPRRARHRGHPAAGLPRPRPRAVCWTSPRPRSPWPASSCAAWTAGPSTTTTSASARASTETRSTRCTCAGSTPEVPPDPGVVVVGTPRPVDQQLTVLLGIP